MGVSDIGALAAGVVYRGEGRAVGAAPGEHEQFAGGRAVDLEFGDEIGDAVDFGLAQVVMRWWFSGCRRHRR